MSISKKINSTITKNEGSEYVSEGTNNVLTELRKIPGVINLLSKQSNKMAALSDEYARLGRSLKSVILVCDVALLKDAMSSILNRINPDVKIYDYQSIEVLIESNTKQSGFDLNRATMIITVCQKCNQLEEIVATASQLKSFPYQVVICPESTNIAPDLESEIDGIISLQAEATQIQTSLISVLKDEKVRIGVQDSVNSDLTELLADLTPRQKEVFDCICIGKCNKEIARDLDLSLSTVKVHCMAIYRGLGVNTRTQAALLVNS